MVYRTALYHTACSLIAARCRSSAVVSRPASHRTRHGHLALVQENQRRVFITTMSAVFIGSGYIIISMYYFGTGGAGKKIYRTCVAHHTTPIVHRTPYTAGPVVQRRTRHAGAHSPR